LVQHFLFRNIVLPAYETWLKRRKTFRYLRDLERSQWQSRRELEDLQLAGLQGLLTHAFQNCPYYRETWSRQGLNPRRLEILADLQRWPVIGRDTIRENRGRMRAQVAGLRLLQKCTGGSSGVPLHFDLDTGSHDRRQAAWYRGYAWGGAGPGAKELYLWSVPSGKPPWWQGWKDRLYNRLHRRRLLNTYALSEERVPAYLRSLNRYRPDAIVAYAQSLYIFARCLEERRLTPFSPRSIIVGAEKLHRFQRAVIERVFQAPVFETYGSREFMLMGAECDRHKGLHLTMEHLLLEVLDDDGRPTPPGQEGNVVVTDLYNYGLPFVRYANGDRMIAGWDHCPCGRGLPLLREVIGRRAEMVHTPDGRHISGVFFPHVIREYPAVRKFLVVQDRPDRILLHLVLGPGWNEAARRSLEKDFRKVIGPAARLDIVPVDHIPLTEAGKHRVVLNLCHRAADPASRSSAPATGSRSSGRVDAPRAAPASGRSGVRRTPLEITP
jgi:phenylacetate-CoA ligase